MFRFPPLTPLVKKLLIALGVAFLAQVLLQNWANIPVFSLIALSTAELSVATLWQLITYMFASGTSTPDAVSLMISMLFLWLMLSPMEQRLGSRRALEMSVAAVLAAGIAAIAMGAIIHEVPPLFGPHPLLLGAFVALPWSYRGGGQVSFFGVVDMKPIHMVWLAVALSILFFLTSMSFVGLAADFGAMGAAIGYLEWLKKPPGRRPRKRKQSGGFRVIKGDRESGPTWLN